VTEGTGEGTGDDYFAFMEEVGEDNPFSVFTEEEAAGMLAAISADDASEWLRGSINGKRASLFTPAPHSSETDDDIRNALEGMKDGDMVAFDNGCVVHRQGDEWMVEQPD
jgi:hypothetical protein